jgi:cytoskeletal protein RodZ
VSLGSELAAARVAQGLSVDDVALATRIRATLIRAIEEDDFSQCGGAVYARGHVRSIARAVGLDPEPLLATFDTPDIATAPAPGLPGGDLLEAEHQYARSMKPQRAHWGGVIMATLAVIIALTVFSLVSNSGNNSGGTAVGTTTPAVAQTTRVSATPSAPAPTHPAVVAPTTAATVTVAPPTPSSDVALVRQTGVTLRLNMIGGRSWFHVADSTGKTLFEGILSTGQTKDFTDPKQIRLIVGAPKTVDLVVNGKDIGSLPETGGNVGHVVFTPAPAKGASHG